MYTFLARWLWSWIFREGNIVGNQQNFSTLLQLWKLREFDAADSASFQWAHTHTHSECIHIRIWLVWYGWERCHLIPPHTQPVIVCERVCVTIQWAQWTSPECRKQKVQPRIMAENLQQQEKLCAYISDSCKTLLLYLFKPVQTYIAGNFGENWKPALGALFFFTAAFGVSFFCCLYFFLNSVRVYFVAVLHRFFFCSKFVVWFYFHGIWLLSQTERERERE